MTPGPYLCPSILKRQIAWRRNRIRRLQEGLERFEGLLAERLTMDALDRSQRKVMAMMVEQGDDMDTGTT
jgi:hypothetical protein